MVENISDKTDNDFMPIDLIKSQQQGLVDTIFGTDSQESPDIVFKRSYISKDSLPQIFTARTSEDGSASSK